MTARGATIRTIGLVMVCLEKTNGRAKSAYLPGMRRCQRLPELTHPVDSARPTSRTSNPVPVKTGLNSPESSGPRPIMGTPADLWTGRQDTTFSESNASTNSDFEQLQRDETPGSGKVSGDSQ